MKMTPALRARFILSADDYGIRSTAEPILRLAREKRLDRVAVMVNSVTREAAELLLQTGVKIDIHLELIALMGRGEKLGDSTLKRGLLFVGRFLTGAMTTQAVESEWRAQIEKFRTLFGRLPDGFNSHEHVHYFPFFFGVFVALAKEYEIPYIRFGKEGVLSRLHQSIIASIIRCFHWWIERFSTPFPNATSDYIVDLNWLESFEHLVDSMPETGEIELIVHPEHEREYNFVRDTF